MQMLPYRVQSRLRFLSEIRQKFSGKFLNEIADGIVVVVGAAQMAPTSPRLNLMQALWSEVYCAPT
jgi:ABC-type bacteriocin/lantibiotic exporter with double-glycine peptidase domain